VSSEREFVVADLPWLLNLNSPVNQVLANRLIVHAKLSGKPFDRLHLAVQPDKLIDLFRPQLGCRRRDSSVHLCCAALRFRTKAHIRKRLGSHAMFGIGLQEPHFLKVLIERYFVNNLLPFLGIECPQLSSLEKELRAFAHSLSTLKKNPGESVDLYWA
jgi:hypothetical protein